MKSLVLICFLLVATLSCLAQANLIVVGKVTDQNRIPLANVKIHLWSAGGHNKDTTSDRSGSFIFKNVLREEFYLISGKKDEYLRKTVSYDYDSMLTKDTFCLNFSLRERSVALVDVSGIDARNLGMTIREALSRFNIDTAEAVIQHEPPGIARGIETELGDSTFISLQINRTANFRGDFRNILDEKVIGIFLAFTNCKTKHWGIGFGWWGQRNPYCKPVKD